MGTVVGPDTPIVGGFSLGVFAVLVVQEGDDLFQHRLGHRKARAKHRPGELEGEVCADTLVHNEILEARSRPGARVVVKIDALVDTLGDRVAHGGVETGLSEALAGFEVALIEEFVAWNRHPVDVAKPAADADTGTVLGIVELRRSHPASPQLRVGRLLVLARAFDVHDCVPGDTALTLQLGTELARRAKFDVVREEPLIYGVRASLDD